MSTLKKLITSATLLISLGSQAHTPYLKPYSFEPVRGDIVTLDASFAEQFFVPEVAFANSIYTVVKPDGKSATPDFLSQLKTRVVVEHEMQEDGTYRFSTGHRYGRVFKTYEQDGERKSMQDPSQPLPEGAKLLSFFQSLTIAETYVSKGAPNDAALRPHNKGLEFIAQTHPNDLFVGEAIEFVSHFEGKPLADLNVSVFLAKDQFSEEDKADLKLISDAEGKFSFTPEQAGVYLIMARHRSDAPESSPAPQISNTYTLVLEAVE